MECWSIGVKEWDPPTPTRSGKLTVTQAASLWDWNHRQAACLTLFPPSGSTTPFHGPQPFRGSRQRPFPALLREKMPGMIHTRSNRRKGSLKRDAFNPADAPAITDESRLALPVPRRLQTGAVQPRRGLGCPKRNAFSPADAPAITDERRLAPPTRRQDQTRRV